MIEDIIANIKDSEKKSNEIIAEAKKQYTAIIENAYAQEAEIIADARSESENIILQEEEKAANDAVAEKNSINAEFEKRIMEVEKASSKNAKEALEIIIRKVFD